MAVDPARAKSLFLNAAELSDPAQRAAFLDRECASDAELRQRVEALLAADGGGTSPEADATGMFEPTAPATLAPTVADDAKPLTPSELATAQFPSDAVETADSTFAGTSQASHNSGFVGGQVIAGRYTLVDVIGEGGMGSVYRASQSQPVKRQVALKLIKVGMNSRDVLARFDAERQALALMDHPNIARIYDGGVTDAGQPFFVMELVDGVPLTEYCDQKRLPVKARLELFVTVCQAVQHAHQKGIIHRDLKPSNVLVTEVDGRPAPKVIDFGVAKATEVKLTEMSFADTGAIVGTPTYMSPEQADPSSMDIDTRTDVYALGVMLYELLTGSPPLDASQFKRGAILEMLRMVREVEPPRPSTRLSEANARPNVAANRSIDPAKLAKLLQGELDWVVMKALEKDRARRYDAANSLARDLQRYLSDEVVEARPPSRGYRLKKFVKRNKMQVIAASLVLLALVGGIVGTSIGLVRAEQERQAAERARREVEAKNDALVVERAKVEQRFELAQDAIKTFHTGVSEDFMLKEKDLAPLRKKLLGSARSFYMRLEGQLQGQNDRASRAALAKAYNSVAKLTWEIESAQAALATFQQALALQRTLAAEEGAGPDATADLAETLQELSQVYYSLSKNSEKAAAEKEALSLLHGLVESHPNVERYQADLAFSLMLVGFGLPPSEMENSYQKSEEIYQRLVRAHPEKLDYLQRLAGGTGGLGLALRMQGRVADGDAALKRAIALNEQLVRAEPGNAMYRTAFAIAYYNYGAGLDNSRSEEALTCFLKARDIWDETLAEHSNSIVLQNNVGFIHDGICKRLCVLDRPLEEAAAFERQSAAYERVARSDPSNPNNIHEVADCQEILSMLYTRAGRPADALAAGQRAVAIREELARTSPDFQPDRLPVCHLKLGDFQKAVGNNIDARASYEKALAYFQKKAAAEGSNPTANTLRGLGDAFRRLDRTAEAAKACQDALALIQSSKSPGWFDLARTRAMLAGIATEPGSGLTAAEGETHAAEAVVALRRFVADRHATVQEAVRANYVDVSSIDKNYQFESLRQREDFRQLLEEMRALKSANRP